MYREYDHEGVARAYDIPSSAPAEVITAHLARYRDWSRRVRSCLPAQLDVPYGARPGQKLDIFMAQAASGPAPAPIVAYFHGGGWRHGSKDERAFPAEVFTAAGAIWIAVGYSLCPVVTIDEMIEEARAAMVWIHRHASTFGGDPRRIYAAGTSAGSHLAAMALGAPWQNRGLPADLVRGGFLVSGIFDFEPLTHHRFPDPAERFRDPGRQNAPRSHRRLSPMSYLPRAGDVVVAVGENEPSEFRRQSIDYYDALRQSGMAAKLLLMPGQDHFSIIGEWGRPAGALVQSVLAELGLL